MSKVLKKYEWAWHVLFWTVFILLMTLIFARFLGFGQALIRNLANCIVLAPMVYLNLYFLVEKFLFKEKYLEYAGIILVVITITSPVRAFIDNLFQFNSSNPLTMYSVAHYSTIVLSAVIMLGVTTTLKVLEDWYNKNAMAADLARLTLEAELKLLKAQVNPHFLFNVLNNIYTLTYLEGKVAAPQILKLSGLMRYMLYDSNDRMVDLTKELDYINNYLDLQQLKNNGSRQVQLTVSGHADAVKIAPLLFIPFFENAFKHGNVLNNPEGFIKALITITPESLLFSIENSIAAPESRKDQVGGIGLENVKKRLNLLYQNKHELTIRSLQHIFSVNLTISLK